jgi:hypothetical protein
LDGTCGRIKRDGEIELEDLAEEDPDAPPLPPDFREVKIGLVAHLRPPGTTPSPRRKKKKRRVRPHGEEPTLTNKKLAVHLGSPLVLFQMLLLLVHRMGLSGARTIVVVGDGAHWIWCGAKEHLTGLGPKIVEILDYWHAVEHLWHMAHSVFGRGTVEATAWVKPRETELLTGRLADFFVALDELHAKAKLLDPARMAVVGKTTVEKFIGGQIQYFRNNEARIHYATYLSQGLIIGSGAMEGSCKHHVKERIDRAGMRWGPEGAMAILRNRTLIKNGDWAHFWHDQAIRRAQAYQQWASAVGGTAQ